MVSVGLQTDQGFIPGVLQVDSGPGGRRFPLVTVTFCDFEHDVTPLSHWEGTTEDDADSP
jgi:hypothetical protein